MPHIKVTVDLDGVYTRFSEGRKRSQQVLANTIHKDMEPFVPLKDGPLRGTSTIDIHGEYIQYNMKYAKKQFYIQHQNYTTGGTGPRWDIKAKNLYMSKWVNVVKAEY